MTIETTQISTDAVPLKIVPIIAKELGVGIQQVSAAVTLLDGGATVPFIARYRKEATGNLDDTQLRALEDRLRYLRELEERRTAVLASIEEQGFRKRQTIARQDNTSLGCRPSAFSAESRLEFVHPWFCVCLGVSDSCDTDQSLLKPS